MIDPADMYRDVQVRGGLTALVRLTTLRASLAFAGSADVEPVDAACTVACPPPAEGVTTQAPPRAGSKVSEVHVEVGTVEGVLAAFRDDCFDACVCDPPYGFSFMGKSWDYDVPSIATWRAVWRVLKPGAALVAFGGARTYHRLACGIEDAGFELRDCLMWLYGKGFPKSQDVSKAIDKSAGHWRGRAGAVDSNNVGMGGPNYERTPKGDPVTAAAAAWHGYGTALKPAHEPIVLARKPLDGTMVQNVARWGVGGLAIDASRVGSAGGTAGRWPANLILDEEAGALLDASVAPTTSRAFPENDPVERAGVGVGKFALRTSGGYSDSGGPSRFFYSAKVSTKEREAGCEGLPIRTAGEVTGGREEDSAGLDSPRAGAGRGGGARNHHPTLKPIALTTYLARLVLPPSPGGVLVPFAGAGSEVIGCALAGWPHVVGVEQSADYAEIARARVAHWLKKEGA